jgi:putative ABC transport system permease protein
MDTIRQDMRDGWRALRRAPGFSAVVIAVVAVGIGANTAIFSVVRSVLLRPLPYREPARLVLLRETYKGRFGSVTAPNFVDWRRESRGFTDLVARERTTVTLTGSAEPERLSGVYVSASYFELLGIAPLRGRFLLPEDGQPGAPAVAVLSEGLWNRRYAGDPGVLGRSILLDGRPHTVVGVAPAGIGIPGAPEELWLPLSLGPADLQATGSHRFAVLARLKPETSLLGAAQEMKGIAAALETVRPQSNQGFSVDVIPLHARLVQDARPLLLTFLGAVGLVALIACANVANLLLARATAREREMAVRTALGASGARLLRQLLAESVLLALVGGAAGLLAGSWGSQLLVAFLPSDMPRLSEVRTDAWVFGFTLLLSLATGLLFGLAPALHALKLAPNASLKEAGRSVSSGRLAERMRGALMVSEVALALLLLVGAGLLLRSFVRLQSVDPGFDSHGLLALRVSLPALRYAEPQRVAAFYRDVVDGLAALPGVTAAAATSHVPLAEGGPSIATFVEGVPHASPRDVPTVFHRAVSPSYFRTLGIPLLRGRGFGASDTDKAPRVGIVNATMAQQLWPNQDPLGKRFTLDDDGTSAVEVVGVVRDIRHFGLDSDTRPELYVPYSQLSPMHWGWLDRSLTVVLRGSVEPRSLLPAVRTAIARIDKDLPLYNVWTMQEVLATSVADRRVSMSLLGVFALAALLLASVGLYGVVSYTVGQRTQEFGVRLALGARQVDVVRLVLVRGLKLVWIGLAIGFAAALALSRALASLVFGIGVRDPLTFFGVGLLLAGVALLASYLPARRAARVDPVTALRYE